jgi:hypothetical protein
MSVIDWVAAKLAEDPDFKIVGRTPEDFLIVDVKNNYRFFVAILGIKTVINLSDVQSLFAGANKPQFVINVPSGTLWSGAAIDYIHAQSAAFGTMGDLTRAALREDAGSYRDDHKMGFFIDGITQHSNVSSVSYVYDRVFQANRKVGPSLVIAVIDAYNMSAEDVRNARTRLGHFDVVVKVSSYGSITSQAEAAAKSIGAQALTFRELMVRLAK